jgi:hypothetical protein
MYKTEDVLVEQFSEKELIELNTLLNKF